MFKIIVGHSNDPGSESAISDVIGQCRADLQGQSPQAAILFAAPDFEHALILQAIQQAFPDTPLIGGTSDGELSSKEGFQQDSLVLTLFCSDEVEFATGVGYHLSQDPIQVTHQAIASAKSQLTGLPGLCISIPESLTASGVAVLDGLKKALGQFVPIVGGTSGDQWQFNGTFQFFGTEVLSDAIPVLLLSDQVMVGHGVANGWQPVGSRKLVTKVENNVLHQVGDQSALAFCNSHIASYRPTPEYRLAVYEPGEEQWYLRTSNGFCDSSTGSLGFFADIPLNAEVQIIQSNRDDMVDAVRTSIEMAQSNYPGQGPEAALFFSCAGRLQALGTRIKEESEVIGSTLPSDFSYGGFYTYGEITPMRQSGESRFHNETFVTLLLGTR